MPLYNPPSSFSQDLQAYDPLLRVRWSDHDSRWRIERKVTRGRPVDPALFQNPEDARASCEGYVGILKVKHNQLDGRVLYTLWKSDLWRQGGADAVADAGEQEEANAREASRERFLDSMEQSAKERYRYMNRVRTLPEHGHTTGRDMSINLGV